MADRDTATADTQAQPIWMKDWVVWLEKIEREQRTEYQRVQQIQELLSELPGLELPEEYCFTAKESDRKLELGQDVEMQPRSLSDEDRAKIQRDLENARENEYFSQGSR